MFPINLTISDDDLGEDSITVDCECRGVDVATNGGGGGQCQPSAPASAPSTPATSLNATDCMAGPIAVTSGALTGTIWIDADLTAGLPATLNDTDTGFPQQWPGQNAGKPNAIGAWITLDDANAGKPCGDSKLGKRVFVSAYSIDSDAIQSVMYGWHDDLPH